MIVAIIKTAQNDENYLFILPEMKILFHTVLKTSTSVYSPTLLLYIEDNERKYSAGKTCNN